MADLEGFKTAGSSRPSRSTASLRSKRFTALLRSKPRGSSKFNVQEFKERATRSTSKSEELTESATGAGICTGFSRPGNTLVCGCSVRGMVYLAGTKLNPSRFAPAERFESQQAKKIGPWRRSCNTFADAKCMAS
jgi:hypothetical protein